MIVIGFIVTFMAGGLVLPLNANMPCVPSSFGYESVVCVCNVTYCDTIPSIQAINKKSMSLYTSSKDGLRFNLSSVYFTTETRNSPDALLTLHPERRLQQILGFGGAFTDSAVNVIKNLNSGAQENLLKAYFSPSGLRYTLVRVPIGCTDFSLREYSFNPYPEDFHLKTFQLTTEEIDGKIPLIKKAQSNAGITLKLIACAWAAPAWMKIDNKILSRGEIRSIAYRAWARYHIRFLEAYKALGLTFWGISSGNEPGNAFFSIHWTPAALAFWIGHFFGPRLKTSFPDVNMLLLDDFPDRIIEYSPVMNNRKSGRFLSGWALHPYMNSSLIQPNLQLAHRRFPDKFILSTEFTVGIGKKPSVKLGSWENAEDYAYRIIQSLNNWAVGWLDWNIALNRDGGPSWQGDYVDSAIVTDGETFYKQPTFYAQGHFSRFITPGSTIIGHTLTPDNVVDVTSAITHENQLVAVILNKKKTDVTIAIKRGTDPTMALFVVPGRSIVTAICLHNF